MRLSLFGQIVKDVWEELPLLFRSIEIGEYVIMPDHFHGILDLRPKVLGNNATFKSLGRTVGALKSISAKRINELRGTPGVTFWQRGFYDRRVRDDSILARVHRYIADNPGVLHRRVIAHALAHRSGGLQSATTMRQEARRSKN